MESCFLRSPSVTSIPQSSLSRYENTFGYFRFLKFPSSMKYPHGTKLKFLNVKAQYSGAMKASSEAIGATPTGADLKENDLVFVAGATGRVGSRTVRELLKLGFRVRGGVRSTQRAESLVQSIKQMKFDSETSRGIQPVEKLEIVECDLEKPDKIRPALGNSSVVICCIGASEKEVFDVTGPYRIDYQATKNLIDAATVAKVNHFIMVSSLGTNKVGFPAAILNLFWGVLIWKRRAEEALIVSGVPYTIVRPGGMERPTDAYKETHNLTLSQEDTLFGGQVSNLQVAELMACMARNRSLSYCKVVEVIAETTAPLTPMEELLVKIPSQRVEQKESIDRDEPPSTPLKSTVSEEPNALTEKEPLQPKAVESRPLSPYSAYEDLKPPSSPSLTQSMSTPVATKTSDSVAAPSLASVPPPSSEPLSITAKDEPAQEDVKKERPLSPYTAYADLKPPASPSPTPPVIHNDLTTTNEAPNAVTSDTPTSTPDTPTDITETVAALEAALRTRPLSPYTAYDDLKPPSSPSPTPSGPKDVTTIPSEQMEAVPSANDVTDTPVTGIVDEEESVVDENLPQKPVHYSSPFHMYEELKPPTSPMPSAPGRS